MMRSLHTVQVACLAAGLAAACMLMIAAPVAAQNAQQDKMTRCNADAKTKSLTGDDRKAFMKTCLSNAPASAPTGNSQQQKMKSCNADAKAKALKGDDRKAFMKTCLSGSG